MHAGKVQHALQLAQTLVQRHSLAVAVPSGDILPHTTQTDVAEDLQRRYEVQANALDTLRGAHRVAQQEAQQRLSAVEAKLASFQTDVNAKAGAQASVQRAPSAHKRQGARSLPFLCIPDDTAASPRNQARLVDDVRAHVSMHCHELGMSHCGRAGVTW